MAKRQMQIPGGRTLSIRTVTRFASAFFIFTFGISASAQVVYSFTGGGLMPPSYSIPFSSPSFYGATVNGSIGIDTSQVVPIMGGEGIKSIYENSPVDISLSNGTSVSTFRNWTYVDDVLASKGAATMFGDFFYPEQPTIFLNDSNVAFMGLTFFLPDTVPADLLSTGASLEGVNFGATMKLRDMISGQVYDFAFTGTFNSPVPEPGAHTMLLAGLGLMIVIRRRRTGTAA